MPAPATYAALTPALSSMLDLGVAAEGVRIRQLLLLYPERLLEGLRRYLDFQRENPQCIATYMKQHERQLIELGASVTLNEDLRTKLGAAMGAVLAELAASDELQASYLAALSALNGEAMASRLLLMLVLLCAFFPLLERSPRVHFDLAFDELMRTAAPHLAALLAVAQRP